MRSRVALDSPERDGVLLYRPLAFKASCSKALVTDSEIGKVTRDDGIASLEGFGFPWAYC